MTSEIPANLSVKNLKYKKSKEKSDGYVKTYSITSFDDARIKLKLSNVLIPFGIEKYNKKHILNIEIDPKKYNDHHNIKTLLSTFENEFIDISNIKYDILAQDIDGKGYYGNMKESKGGYIIRTNVFSNPEIFADIGGFRTELTSSSIVKSRANVDLELATLWITENNYGICWQVRRIEILT